MNLAISNSIKEMEKSQAGYVVYFIINNMKSHFVFAGKNNESTK